MAIALTFVFSPIYSYADDIYLSKTMGAGINWSSTANYWSPNTPPTSSTAHNYYVGNDTTKFQVRSEDNDTSSTFPGNNVLYLGYTFDSSTGQAQYTSIDHPAELCLKSWSVTVDNINVGNGIIGQSKGTGTIKLNGLNLTVNGTLFFDSSASGRIIDVYNAIYGTGEISFLVGSSVNSVKISSSNNAFTGKLTLVTKSSCTLSGANALPNASQIVINDGGALSLEAEQKLNNLSGSGTIDNGGNALTLNNTAGETTYSGVISGAGTVTKTGSQSLVLSGANSYSGGTTISAGTIKLDGNSARLGAGNVTIAENAALELNGASSGLHSVPSLSGSGAINITANSYFSLANENAQAYSGTFNISKTLHLGYQDEEDSNHYGPANLNLPNATVSLQSSGILALDFDNKNLAPSSLTIKTLNGVAGTTVRAGGSGSPTNPCTITVGDGNFAGVIGVNNSAIHSKLSLIKNTSGTLTLSGTNLYTGGTTISGGTLKLTGAGTLGTGAVTNSGTLEFNNSTATITPNISGAGDILISAGTATLSGAVTQTGGATTLADGTTLSIGSASTLYNLSGGSESNPATLTVTGNLTLSNDDESTFIGSITAQKITVKTANDVALKLYAGANNKVTADSLTVSSGELDFKGYFAGNIEVFNGSVFSPGNSVGTADITGNITFTSATADSNGVALFEFGEYADGAEAGVDYDLFVMESGGIFTADDGVILLDFTNYDEDSWAKEGNEFQLVSGGGFDDNVDYNPWLGNMTDLFKLEGRSADGLYLVGIKAAPEPGSGVPEPSTWALLLLGAAGLLYVRKRTRK